jgi:hypothetical protein
MTTRKAKGTRFESAVRDHLRSLGIPAYRATQEGHDDTGDLHGVDPFILQAKDWQNVTAALREGVDGAQRQARAAGRPFGAAVVKRARRSTGEAYVIMTLDTWADVLTSLRGVRPTEPPV